LAFGTGQAALGDALTDALDDLANLTEQNALGSIDDLKVGFQASLCMEAIGGLSEFLQHVYQIQDQGDIEFLVDSNLERTFPIRQDQTGHGT
jgi:hypothetical protein